MSLLQQKMSRDSRKAETWTQFANGFDSCRDGWTSKLTTQLAYMNVMDGQELALAVDIRLYTVIFRLVTLCHGCLELAARRNKKKKTKRKKMNANTGEPIYYCFVIFRFYVFRTLILQVAGWHFLENLHDRFRTAISFLQSRIFLFVFTI